MIITGLCICGKKVQRRYCSELCKKRDYRSRQTKFTHPESYDEWFKTKEFSYYYWVLEKAVGKAQADLIWNWRDKEEDLDIWNEVKDYKPKNRLVAITSDYIKY